MPRPRKRIIVKCGACDASLERRPSEILKAERHFCNRNCYGIWQSLQLGPLNRTFRGALVPCTHCGTMLQRPPSRLKRPSKHFCNVKCRDDWESANIPRQGVVVECATCEKQLYRMPWEIERNTNHFCNRKCRAKWFSENASGDHSWHWKGGVPLDPCIVCGKEVPKARAHIGIHRTICKDCDKEWRQERMSGEGNPQWQGGNIDYYGPNWRAQRRATRRRDNHTCQHCKLITSKGQRLHDVHHVVPFRSFGYIPGQNDNYKKANDLSNLITLCADCHKKAEWGKIAIQPKLI